MQTDALGVIHPTFWFHLVFCSRAHHFITPHSPNVLSGVFHLHVFTPVQLLIFVKGVVQGAIPPPQSFLQELDTDFKDSIHMNHPVNALQWQLHQTSSHQWEGPSPLAQYPAIEHMNYSLALLPSQIQHCSIQMWLPKGELHFAS